MFGVSVLPYFLNVSHLTSLQYEDLWQTFTENYSSCFSGLKPYVHRALKRLASRCRSFIVRTCSVRLPDFGLK